ncbi:MAG: hypothetical protein ACT4TC_00055 [Myxococcaceae bacterium]
MDLEPGFSYRLMARLPDEPLAEVYDAVLVELPVYRRIHILRQELAADAVAPLLFAAAAQNADKLRHPALAAAVGHGRLPDGRPWLAFEQREGMWLDDWLAAKGAPKPEMLDAFLKALVPGLAMLHEAGVVMGTLCSQKIFLEGGCLSTPVITGLDVVRYPGTPLHPRVHGELARATQSSDIYLLGALLMALMDAPLPLGAAPPQVPEGYERFLPLVDRCLQESPEDRFADACELAKVLVGEANQLAGVQELFGADQSELSAEQEERLPPVMGDPDRRHLEDFGPLSIPSKPDEQDHTATIPFSRTESEARLREREKDDEPSARWFR